MCLFDVVVGLYVLKIEKNEFILYFLMLANENNQCLKVYQWMTMPQCFKPNKISK
jgi:hypothetical protein